MMKNMENDSSKNNLPKWIYVVIAVLLIGFGVYGYFKVSKWVRYAAIERYEKPITDYHVTKVYKENGKDKYKTKGRGVNDDDDAEDEPSYYMEVSYKGKDYRLEIEEYDYARYNKENGKITLYYDDKGDDIFVAGTGGANLLVVALAAFVLLIVIIIFLIRGLFKLFKVKHG
ncbi:MAG: hypothetical protein J5637_08235 [Prevotella sp.]|nr:hypothetical protein [Prevotella sp.]